MKAMLASDYVESKLRFPLYAQPKIDGVRGLNLRGQLTGRSGKTHANDHTTILFSAAEYVGFDGEMAAEKETHPDLCRLTTSALNTIAGQPFLFWHVFDYINENTVDFPYKDRYTLLSKRVAALHDSGLAGRVHVVPCVLVNNIEELNRIDAHWLACGYEGTILRDPNGKYKSGRSTVKEGGLLRIKRFTDSEAKVIGIEQGQTNLNEAKLNEIGLTERSTHQENMVPNGLVGSLACEDIHSGQRITVSPGCMTHEERALYWNRQELLLGRVIKYKFFAKGVKDLPRFPTYQCLRAESDL